MNQYTADQQANCFARAQEHNQESQPILNSHHIREVGEHGFAVDFFYDDLSVKTFDGQHWS